MLHGEIYISSLVLILRYLDVEIMTQLNGHRITKNWLSPTESFLHSTPLNKKVVDWPSYPIETIKNLFESGPNFTSKIG